MVSAFIFSLGVFLYQGVLLLGGALFSERLLMKYCGQFLAKEGRLLFGFALFPVLVTWTGFLGIWRIPFLSQTAGFVLVLFAVRIFWKHRTAIHRAVRGEGRWYIVPGLLFLSLFIMKSGYLLAGNSHGDEGRSIAFVTTFAHNAMKPAFILDTSLPVAYPYYLFSSAAFAYRSLDGYLFPTIPLLAVTLLGLFFAFRAMHLGCREFWGEQGNRIFVFGSLLLSFSSLQAYSRFFADDVPYLFSLTVNPFPEYLHAGYHYILGIGLALLGLAYLWTCMKTLSREAWRVFVLSICLAFGYAGIPILWIIGGVFVLLGLFLLHYRIAGITFFLRELPFSLLLWLVVLLPQIFNFLPRVVPQFYFSLPHVWYLRDVHALVDQAGSGFLWLKKALLGPAMITRGVGPLIFLCLPGGLVIFCKNVRSFLSASALFPLSAVMVVALFILTCTTSATSDWYSRGFIGTTVIGAFMAAAVLLPIITKKTYRTFVLLIGIPLVVLHGTAFALDFKAPSIHEKLGEVKRWNRYPLSTTFYTRDFDETADQILFAGRQLITVPPPPFYAYFLDPSMYSFFGIETIFTPCQKTLYGNNTPSGTFLHLDTNPPTAVPCDELPR